MVTKESFLCVIQPLFEVGVEDNIHTPCAVKYSIHSRENVCFMWVKFKVWQLFHFKSSFTFAVEEGRKLLHLPHFSGLTYDKHCSGFQGYIKRFSLQTLRSCITGSQDDAQRINSRQIKSNWGHRFLLEHMWLP